jgi:acetyl esterase/lipase
MAAGIAEARVTTLPFAQPMAHTFEDVPYRTIAGETLLGRLYRPAEPRAVLVVEVHGGAWTQNDRTTNAVIHRYLADRGITVFALDFRLAPKHRYPAAVQDVNFALRWAKANHARLGVPTGLLGALGTSSGGHLLTLAAIVPDDPRYMEPDPTLAGTDARIDFLVGCWPIFDPLARYRMATARGLANLVNNHHAFWPDEAAMDDGNPHRIVASGGARHLPPALVLQGTGDANVEHTRTDAFVDAWRKAGGTAEYHKFEGEPHTFVPNNPDSPASQDALAKTAAFVLGRLAR